MKLEMTTDMDFLCARVRGLRSRLYSGPSLTALTRLATGAAFFNEVLSGNVPASHTAGQRSIITAHVEHLCRLSKFLSGRRRLAFDWLVRRYQIENLKVILRARAQEIDREAVLDLLFEIPQEYSLPVDEILAAKGVKALAGAIPVRPVAEGIMMVAGYPEDDRLPFFLETAVEMAYLSACMDEISKVRHTERARCAGLVAREVLCHNVLLVWRAIKTYSIEPPLVRDFVIKHGPFRTGRRFLQAFESGQPAEMLNALGPGLVLGRARGDIAAPADAEAALQASLYRAAKRCYAESMFDFGVIVSYYYLKRFELQDLLRLSEAIRQGLGPDEAQAHLVTLENIG